MAQVLKDTVRRTIVETATSVFERQGYHGATVSMIAAKARVAVGTVYTYFPSKLHLLYAVYRPWFTDQMDRIERNVEKAASPRGKLQAIIVGLWRDVPKSNPRLANSLMEALASIDPRAGKPEPLLALSEERLARLLAKALPRSRARYADTSIANILFMAYDGYVINRRLGDLRNYDHLANIMTDLLLGRLSRLKRS